MTAQETVRLHNGAVADKASVDALYLSLENLVDRKVVSILHPDATGWAVDSPAVREGALYQAREILLGYREAITKPILIELLCAKGFFTSDNRAQLTVSDVANDLTRDVILSAVQETGVQNQVKLRPPHSALVPIPG